MSYPSLTFAETISFFSSLLGLIAALELSFYITNIIHTERYEFTKIFGNDREYLESLNTTGKRLGVHTYEMASLIGGLSSNDMFTDFHANQDLSYIAHHSAQRRKIIFEDRTGLLWNEIVTSSLKNIQETMYAISDCISIELGDPSIQELFKVHHNIKKNTKYYELLLRTLLNKKKLSPVLVQHLKLVTFTSSSVSQLVRMSVKEDRYNLVSSDSVEMILNSFLDLLRLLDLYISTNTQTIVNSKFYIFNKRLNGHMLAHSWAYPLTNVIKSAIYQIVISYFEDIPKLKFSQENATLLQGFVDFSK